MQQSKTFETVDIRDIVICLGVRQPNLDATVDMMEELYRVETNRFDELTGWRSVGPIECWLLNKNIHSSIALFCVADICASRAFNYIGFRPNETRSMWRRLNPMRPDQSDEPLN